MDYKDLLEMTSPQIDFGLKYHICKTERLPNKLSIGDFDDAKWEAFKSYVEQNFAWEENDRIRLSFIDRSDTDYVLHLKCGITISQSYREAVNLIFDPHSDSDTLKILEKKFRALRKPTNTRRIGVIRNRGDGLGVKFFEYKLLENDLMEYMGNDLQNFYKDMVGDLQSEHGKGLYLLYGKPGTGKTSFIKKVLSEIDKKALFISPSYTEQLTSPELISLLMDYPDSVLVIEDAETAIMERKADNSSSVSNLLNLTDGFLSDFLNLKIICTFNTNLTNIDSALLRNGRLRGMHEFKKLDSQKVQKIASLLDVDLPSNEPMTIAEICNPDKNVRKNGIDKIGFAS